MKIAVVSNLKKDGVISHFGRPCRERCGRKTLGGVMDGLREGGHTVMYAEADCTLADSLRGFMGVEGVHLPIVGMVFNMAYGIQGNARYTHVPAILEMSGVPYTGSDPLGHALALDKVTTKVMLQNAGIPTPRFKVMTGGGEDAGDLRFPLIVKPRTESTSFGLRLVYDVYALADAVDNIVAMYHQSALVEEYIEGREFCVGLLGNERPEVLPIVEIDFAHRGEKYMTLEDKYHKRTDEPVKLCPAPISGALAKKLEEISVAVFNACHCRDYGRVDIRLDSGGNPYVLELNSMASLGAGGSFVLAGKTAGYDLGSLVNRIVNAAHKRYFGTEAPKCKNQTCLRVI